MDMKEVNHLSTLQDAISVFTSEMSTFQQKHRAYKFQFAVDVVFRKTVDPAVGTQPTVTRTSEMVAVYPDLSPLDDVYRQLLNFIEVYEHNGSGWVFSYFTSLQLTLWHLDPLRAGAFVPLNRWIQDKRAVINVVGTGEDCVKCHVLAVMHPVDKRDRNPNRMSGY